LFMQEHATLTFESWHKIKDFVDCADSLFRDFFFAVYAVYGARGAFFFSYFFISIQTL
jgi:hypothetical protein